jgi:hypothetical protein
MLPRFTRLLRHVLTVLEMTLLLLSLSLLFAPGWRTPLFHLFAHSWRSFLFSIGTTGPGFVSPLLISLLGVIAALLCIGYLRGKDAMLRDWRENTAITALVTLTVLLVVYGPQFAWVFVRVVHEDHKNLVHSNQTLKQENQRLSGRTQYETSMLNSFAFTNTVHAFAYLQNPQAGNSLATKTPCQIKVTAPKENEAVQYMLFQIAGSVGCNLIERDLNPNLNPDFQAQATDGATTDFLLIHAAKDNSRANSFINDMSNTFSVKRTYTLPNGSPHNLIWIQVGPGSIWRKDK